MNTRRRGVVLVAAIVCLLVVMLMGAAILRSIALRHRQGREDLYRMQALWLAESAAERCAARLRDERGYTGETWRVRLAQGAAAVEGTAVIRVEPAEGHTASRRVRIEAHWPDHPLHRRLLRKELLIQLPTGGP